MRARGSTFQALGQQTSYLFKKLLRINPTSIEGNMAKLKKRKRKKHLGVVFKERIDRQEKELEQSRTKQFEKLLEGMKEAFFLKLKDHQKEHIRDLFEKGKNLGEVSFRIHTGRNHVSKANEYFLYMDFDKHTPEKKSDRVTDIKVYELEQKLTDGLNAPSWYYTVKEKT